MRIKFILLFILIKIISFAQVRQNGKVNKTEMNLDYCYFIENKGQWNSDVLYLYRMRGLDLWITKYGMNYTFYKIEKEEKSINNNFSNEKFEQNYESKILIGHRILFELQNYNNNIITEGKQKM